MARFGKKDAPRVVGFDFAGPPAPLPSYASPEGTPAPFAPPEAAAEPRGQFEAPAAPSPYAPSYAAPVATLPQPDWAPQSAPPPSWPAPFQPPVQWQSPTKRRSKILVTGGVILTVVMVGGFFANGGLKGAIDEARPLSTPATLSGKPRLDSPLAEQVRTPLRDSLSRFREVQIATYGTDADLYLLVAGKGGEDSTGEALDNLTDGLRRTTAKVGALQRVGSVGCYPVTIARMQGTVCGWGGHASDGVVFAYQNPNVAAVAAIAQQARTEVQGG